MPQLILAGDKISAAELVILIKPKLLLRKVKISKRHSPISGLYFSR